MALIYADSKGSFIKTNPSSFYTAAIAGTFPMSLADAPAEFWTNLAAGRNGSDITLSMNGVKLQRNLRTLDIGSKTALLDVYTPSWSNLTNNLVQIECGSTTASEPAVGVVNSLAIMDDYFWSFDGNIGTDLKGACNLTPNGSPQCPPFKKNVQKSVLTENQF